MIGITGASGWFGKNSLTSIQENYLEHISKYVIPFSSSFKKVVYSKKFDPIQSYNLEKIVNYNNFSGLIHNAFIRGKLANNFSLKEYISKNRSITNNIVQTLKNNPNIPIICFSSGIVNSISYKQKNISLNPYAYLKFEEELRLKEMVNSRMVIIFRVFAATGPHLTIPSHYALSDFLEEARNYNRISIKSESYLYRSYVYLPDLMQLCFRILQKPLQNGYYVFDACSENLEIGDIAKSIQKLYKNLEIKRNLNKSQSASYVGDTRNFKNLLSKYKLKPTPLDEQIKETAENLLIN